MDRLRDGEWGGQFRDREQVGWWRDGELLGRFRDGKWVVSQEVGEWVGRFRWSAREDIFGRGDVVDLFIFHPTLVLSFSFKE